MLVCYDSHHALSVLFAVAAEYRHAIKAETGLQLRSMPKTACCRRAADPCPFSKAIWRKVLYTPGTVRGAGRWSIVCSHDGDILDSDNRCFSKQSAVARQSLLHVSPVHANMG